MDPEKKSLNFIFPTKYVIPKSLKFSHWPSKFQTTTQFLKMGNLIDISWVWPFCQDAIVTTRSITFLIRESL